MTPSTFDPLLRHAVQPIIDLALAEDLGTGDVTTLSTVPDGTMAEGIFLAKSHGILAGLPVVEQILQTVDPRLKLFIQADEGHEVTAGEQVAEVGGPARSLLAAERTALNFLQRMSGIATMTAKFVRAIAGTGAKIVDTRKTAPGLRVLDKYAVRMGGGFNHRLNLADGVLIKDNHIAAVGGVAEAIAAARERAPHTLKIEVEVVSIDMAKRAVDAGADIILLDNMDFEAMHACVAIANARGVLTEASGGVTLERIRAIAATGVDLISVGALTHSVTAMDISLDFH